MSNGATAQYEVVSWQEEPLHEGGEAATITKATVSATVKGALVGLLTIEYLMAYPAERTSVFVGIARFEGEVDGRSGQFVATVSGSFGGTATEQWTLIEGTGRGDLAGITGTVQVSSIDTTHAELNLTYRLS